MCLRKLLNKFFKKNIKLSSSNLYNDNEGVASIDTNQPHKNKINVVSCKIKLIEE